MGTVGNLLDEIVPKNNCSIYVLRDPVGSLNWLFRSHLPIDTSPHRLHASRLSQFCGKLFASLQYHNWSVFWHFSVSALLMMVTLKKLASTGCTLIFTIYQSSTEVFGLFDRICLLSNGNTLFFGETLSCLQVNNILN